MEPNKGNKWCFVPKCGSTSRRTPDKVFITVPKYPKRKYLWFKAARRDPPTSQSIFFCCEDHFNLPEDVENYVKFKLMGGKILIKPHVVPHIFDCQVDRKRAFTAPVRPVVLKRNRKELVEQAMKSFHEEASTSSYPETTSISTASELTEENSNALPQHVPVPPVKIKEVRHVGVQVRPSYRSKYAVANISNNSEKYLLTSPMQKNTIDTASSPIKLPTTRNKPMPNINSDPLDESFNESESDSEEEIYTSSEFSAESDNSTKAISCLETTISCISKNPKRYIGVTGVWFHHIIDYLCRKGAVQKKHVLLTLMKIKLDDSLARLGDLFDLSEGHVSKVYNKTVQFLSHILATLIYWPNKKTIQKLMPIPFRARYYKVQSIIDCLEIEIEKPNDALNQSLTWSDYKKCNTIKYLISSTPDGFIHFISSGYCGRTSDMALFEKCGYLKQLPPGCSVMADRGFKGVEKLIEQKHCKLVRPPSVFNSAKPSKQEVVETKRIASLRIHIERVIRRIREYKSLKPHSVIHHSLLGKTDNVITIACALINLQSSVIKQGV